MVCTSRGPRPGSRFAVGLLCALSLGAASLCASGCAVPVVALTAGIAVAQTGTAAYARGELQVAYLAPIDEVYAATRSAMAELELDVQADRPPRAFDGRTAYINAQEPGGPEIKVTLDRVSESATKVRIRVAIFGDEAVSRLVLARIDARLPEPPARVPIDPIFYQSPTINEFGVPPPVETFVRPDAPVVD